MEKQKKSAKEKLSDAQTETSTDLFKRAKYMLAASVGRLPTTLVVLLLVSLALATVTGMAMQLKKPDSTQTQFMPQRIDASDDAVEIDPKKLNGNWVYQNLDYAMALTFIGDRFEWIIVFKDIPEAQFFARGNFRLVGDVMILGIRADLGTPRDPAKPWMKYMPIAMKDLNTKFGIRDKQIIWDVPSSEQRKIMSQSARIFADHTEGHFEWTQQ